jgi:hypothetical protein
LKEIVMSETCGVGFLADLDGLGRGNQTVLFENSERVFILGDRESVSKGDLALILGGSDEPETDLRETVFLNRSELEGAGSGGKLNVLSVGRQVKAKVGFVITAILERRIGIGLGGRVG